MPKFRRLIFISRCNIEYELLDIPNYFLYENYSNLNEIVNFDLITDKIKFIGNRFLYKNPIFNQEINLPNIEEIGDEFLFNLKLFNSPINFGNKLKKIGSRFISQNPYFNQNIIFPDSIEYINLYAGFLSNIKLDLNHYIKLPKNFLNIINNQQDNLTEFGYNYISTGGKEFQNLQRKKIKGFNINDFNELKKIITKSSRHKIYYNL